MASGCTNAPQEAQLSPETILGHWCTANYTYDFTAEKLTVKSASFLRVMHITGIRTDGSRVVVSWAEDDIKQNPANRGRGSHTTFTQFGGGRMVQISEQRYDGSSTPTFEFHRC